MSKMLIIISLALASLTTHAASEFTCVTDDKRETSVLTTHLNDKNEPDYYIVNTGSETLLFDDLSTQVENDRVFNIVATENLTQILMNNYAENLVADNKKMNLMTITLDMKKDGLRGSGSMIIRGKNQIVHSLAVSCNFKFKY